MKEWFKLPSYQQGLTKLKLRENLIQKITENQENYTNEIVDIWFSEPSQHILGSLVNRLKK